MARPRTRDREKLMANVCRRISGGELVKDAAKAEGVDAASIRQWAAAEPFASLYARAREDQAHALAEQIVTLSDDATKLDSDGVAAKRLQIDARKWVAARIAPKHYGDRMDVTSGDKPLTAPQVVMIGDKRIEF